MEIDVLSSPICPDFFLESVRILLHSKNRPKISTVFHLFFSSFGHEKSPIFRALLTIYLFYGHNMETHVTNDTMHTRKAKGVRSAPHSPQIFCTNSVPSFKTNTIFPSRCTTAFSTAASHNCVSNSGSIPFCPFNTL